MGYGPKEFGLGSTLKDIVYMVILDELIQGRVPWIKEALSSKKVLDRQHKTMERSRRVRTDWKS